MIPTPHIELDNPSLVAKTVLMPGDPLRAEFIAKTYLTNVMKINGIRNMFGYTGTYKGKQVTVMGSGMGMPSIGIYSYELFSFYGVENIIRIGSAGSYKEGINVYDVVLARDAYSYSTYAKVMKVTDSNILEPSKSLNNKIIKAAAKLSIPLKEVRVHSSDVFYGGSDEHLVNANCDVVEMESFALFANAKKLGKSAACLLTISDSFVTKQVTTSKERQEAFTKMMEIALEAAIN